MELQPVSSQTTLPWLSTITKVSDPTSSAWFSTKQPAASAGVPRMWGHHACQNRVSHDAHAKLICIEFISNQFLHNLVPAQKPYTRMNVVNINEYVFLQFMNSYIIWQVLEGIPHNSLICYYRLLECLLDPILPARRDDLQTLFFPCTYIIYIIIFWTSGKIKDSRLRLPAGAKQVLFNQLLIQKHPVAASHIRKIKKIIYIYVHGKNRVYKSSPRVGRIGSRRHSRSLQ